MSKNTKAKGKIVRRLGVNIYGNPKYDRLLEKKSSPPGMQGGRRRARLSDYGVQLVEKQKLRFTYGLSEHQFRRVFAKAKNMKGITGDNMLILLERRLDNIVYRLGMAATRAQARQIVGHGHVRINGHRASTPSMLVSPEDKIAAKDKKSSQTMIKDQIESTTQETPSWLAVDEKSGEGLMVRMPIREDIPTVADEQLIVEYYSK